MLWMIVGLLILIAIAKFILHLNLKKIISLIVNTVIGALVIYILNWTGLVSIPLNIWTSLAVGIFGVPGAIVLIILAFLGII